MKRAFIAVLMLLVPALLFSGAWMDARASFGYWYTTNAFSSPLPNGYGADESYPATGEFIKRHDIGGSLSLDIYFSDGARTGVSAAAAASYPLSSTAFRPDKSGEVWTYDEIEPTAEKDAELRFGFGPVFRFDMGDAEIILPIRLSVGTFDCFSSGLIFGVWVEPAVNVFFTENLYFSAGITYNANLMKFLFGSEKVYDEGYIKLSIGGFVGLGVRIGG